MSVCVRGCTLQGLHKRDCRNESDCRGCVPVEASVGRWCARCASDVRGWIVDLPDLAAEVAVLPEGRLNAGQAPVSDAPRAPSKEAASVSPAYDAGEEAARWLHSWTDLICDQLALIGPPRYSVLGVPVLNPHACAAFLRQWVSWPAEHEPLQFHAELRGMHAGLIRALGRDVPVKRYSEPCPRCDLRTMAREDGADVVCGNDACQAVYRLDEWERLTGVAS